MKNILIAVSILLTGCGTYGEPLLLAKMFDSADKCQLKNNGGNYPSYCGAGSARTVIYSTPNNNPVGAAIGYTSESASPRP
jgi:hypothetical protein